jgi:hypothetical protein
MRRLPPAVEQAMKQAGVKPKPSKYRAVPTVVDGIRFDSKAEAEYFKDLKWRVKEGWFTYILRQIPFDLPGGYKHRVDFMAVTDCGHGEMNIEYYEVKGKDIGTGKMKRKQVEEIYGVKIHVMKAVYQRGVIVSFEEVIS